jgi:hypothetical protein
MERTAVIAWSAAVLAAAGCGSSGRDIPIGRFSAGAADPAAVGAPGPIYSVAAPAPAEGLRIGATDQVTDPGGGTESRPIAEQGAVILDAKIGDVNGRPVLASVFLEELLPRLRAASRTSPGREAWRAEASRIIGDKLAAVIRDEVLYREARSRLPEQVREGLFTWISQVRERVRQLNQGSSTAADARLRESYGMGLDEYLRAVERGEVIRQVLDAAASEAPPVTWADIRNEFERRRKEFAPPPRIYARMILCPDSASASAVGERLSAGEPFATVAADRAVNRYRPEQAGAIGDGGITVEGELPAARLVGIQPLNAALVALEPGAWAGPVAYENPGGGAATGFVHVERIARSARSLDEGDLQLELQAEISARREGEARERFLMSLLDAAGLGPQQQAEMTGRLVEVAEARVFGPGGG